MIEIKKEPYADSRYTPSDYTFEKCKEATDMHRNNVREVMNQLGGEICARGLMHDFTKKVKMKDFYKQFSESKENGTEFKDSEWYKYHITNERHHLNSCCPDDVNLVDVLEMICDCVCAGYARAGEVSDITLENDDILNKAFKNTIEKIKKMVVLNDNGGE